MDQDDPFDGDDEFGLGDDSYDDVDDDVDGAEAHPPGSAPGSLTSLRIRKRTPAPRTSPGAPRRAAPPAPEADDRQPPRNPEPRTQATRPARPAAPVHRPAMPAAAPTGTIPEPAGSESAGAEPPLAPPAPHVDPGAAPAERAQATGIVPYWTQIKGGRRFPRVTDLDHARVTSTWPNSILMRCRAGSKALQPDRIFSAGEGGGTGLSSLRTSARINLSPMMLQWLIGLAGEVVRTGRPMQDEEEFPSSQRSARYRAVALPFSNDDNAVDHVLCHVSPAN